MPVEGKQPEVRLFVEVDDGHRVITYTWVEVEADDEHWAGWECWRRVGGESHRVEELDKLSTAGIYTMIERIRDHPEDPPR